ncbi:MAG: glycosyltransferase family 39 protein, partial [Polyangiaceae bacterium]|nr:glycosyltransferase family 39 protein [Polyangiaceae bacterium]
MPDSHMREQGLRALVVAWTLSLLAVHLYASKSLGFGDSEALYATYSLHPQATYVDHPGAVGFVFAAVGRSPSRVHLLTSFLFLLDVFLFYRVSLALGAREKRALAGTFLFATVPALSIGLFALTPDALLCPLWLLLTAAFARAQRHGKGLRWIFVTSFASFVKVTFIPLALAMATAAYVSGRSSVALRTEESPHLVSQRRILPALLFATFSPVALLVALDQSAMGAGMFHHRLFEHDANAVAWWAGIPKTLLGQLLYLGPAAAVLGALCLVPVWRSFRAAQEPKPLRLLFVIPFAILLTTSLLTPHSEPHWLTPAWISLLLWLSVDDQVTPLASSPGFVKT